MTTTFTIDQFPRLFAGADAKIKTKLANEVFPLLRACADQGAISTGDLKMVKKVLDAAVKQGFAATVATEFPDMGKPGDWSTYNPQNANVVKYIEWNRFDKLRDNARKLDKMTPSPVVDAAKAFIAEATPLLEFMTKLEGQSLKKEAATNLDAGNFPLLEVTSSEKLFAKFRDTVLPTLNKAIQEQSIYNPDYEGCKDVINRLLRGAEEGTVKATHLRNADRDDEIGSKLYYSEFSLARIHGLQNKLAKMPQDHNVVRAATKLCQEVAPLASVMEMLKPLVVKGRKPNPDAPQAYVPPPASMATLEKLAAILDEVTRDNYQSLVNGTKKWLISVIDSYVEKREKALAANPKARATPRDLFRDDFGAVAVLDDLTDYRNGALLPETKRAEIIQRLAEENATAMMQGFRSKNLLKLSPIIGEKNNLSDITIIHARAVSRNFEGTLKLAFEDGSSFVVNSQVVWAYHNGGNFGRGGWYMRYPTTFHNVVLPNGDKLAQPSEEKMNEVFSKATADQQMKM